MVIDAEFDGLTSLHSPAEYDMGWEMDIIALPGLKGHAIRTIVNWHFVLLQRFNAFDRECFSHLESHWYSLAIALEEWS
ncbi:hypothetical protein DBV05_g6124 [Lasiodiplodia theobromae]|uniref:Uncharacterized protein n=1 Tax=Lasiodiplodia theobromae TaxID=45133 RepID=A0A5N5DBI8_9PEZI|nr:hypothetical protein DBV05_g6124 [Lasiodiplodia theobromae]